MNSGVAVQQKTTMDLQGREVAYGDIPGVGTKIKIAGNSYRLIYKRERPIRLTFELSERYEP